jgi:hypothetical protein
LRSKPTGKQIRAKTAANREKRLDIAEAMKKEAGVTEHTINSEDFAGLAYLGTGRIRSPEGRNLRERQTAKPGDLTTAGPWRWSSTKSMVASRATRGRP